MYFCLASLLKQYYFYNELYQLPRLDFNVDEKRTKVTVFAYKEVNKLDKKEKIRACYQHACLQYVSNDKLTNESLRDRFGIEERNSAIASRIIKDCFIEGLIKEDDPDSKSRKFKGIFLFGHNLYLIIVKPRISHFVHIHCPILHVLSGYVQRHN